MADITITPAGLPFGGTDTVTSTRLNEARNPTAALDAGTIVNADVSATADISGSKLADATVTKAKIENISAPLKVLGRTTAGAGVAEEVTINDDDDLSTASAITLATDESIKAYVDTTTAFTPSTYAGEESVTLPNNLIMKFGTVSGVDPTVSFLDHFTTVVMSVQVTARTSFSDSIGNACFASNVSVSGFNITNGRSVKPNDTINWFAIGY